MAASQLPLPGTRPWIEKPVVVSRKELLERRKDGFVDESEKVARQLETYFIPEEARFRMREDEVLAYLQSTGHGKSRHQLLEDRHEQFAIEAASSAIQHRPPPPQFANQDAAFWQISQQPPLSLSLPVGASSGCEADQFDGLCTKRRVAGVRVPISQREVSISEIDKKHMPPKVKEPPPQALSTSLLELQHKQAQRDNSAIMSSPSTKTISIASLPNTLALRSPLDHPEVPLFSSFSKDNIFHPELSKSLSGMYKFTQNPTAVDLLNQIAPAASKWGSGDNGSYDPIPVSAVSAVLTATRVATPIAVRGRSSSTAGAASSISSNSKVQQNQQNQQNQQQAEVVSPSLAAAAAHPVIPPLKGLGSLAAAQLQQQQNTLTRGNSSASLNIQSARLHPEVAKAHKIAGGDQELEDAEEQQGTPREVHVKTQLDLSKLLNGNSPNNNSKNVLSASVSSMAYTSPPSHRSLLQQRNQDVVSSMAGGSLHNYPLGSARPEASLLPIQSPHKLDNSSSAGASIPRTPRTGGFVTPRVISRISSVT